MTALAEILAGSVPGDDAAFGPFLDELQANLLRPHGRRHAAHLFLSFAGLAPAAVAALLGALGRRVTSAGQQRDAARRHAAGLDGGTLVGLLLGAGGYRALGPGARLPGDPAFRIGMERRGDALADPPRAAWGPGWHDRPMPDAMLLLADADRGRLEAALVEVQAALAAARAQLLVIERGEQQRRRFPGQARSRAVEHFGFALGDGQPRFTGPEGGRRWDTGFPPGQVLVADPNGRSPFAAGSYVVFRKLEQDVRAFKAAEDALADTLFGVHADDVTRRQAGALVMGRREDGTPLLPPGVGPGQDANDFDFAEDPAGCACPLHAHLRKANPRASLPREMARGAVMARRGITYGQRPMLPDGSDFAEPEGEAPTRGVGLLFMACMRDIAAQFERVQAEWANQPGFLTAGTGLDPVIGQGGGEVERSYFWPGGQRQGFAPCVHMLGGEYFFAPSRGWLAGLG